MSSIQIEVKNCNNLDSAVISLAQQKLNIKFAPNGTGESTIARAMLLGAKGEPHLLGELMPFKLRKANPKSKPGKQAAGGQGGGSTEKYHVFQR